MIHQFYCIHSDDQNVDIGIADFVSLMALPSWYWKDGSKFNKLHSINHKAKEQMLSLLNESNMTKDFDFETVLMQCNKNDKISDYCSLLKSLPGLPTTLKLMALAKHPNLIEDHLQSKFR